MITVKIKDGRRQPYLSTDRNHIRADSTRLLEKQLGQVSKKYDQCPRRRCDNEKKFTDVWADGHSNILGLGAFPIEILYRVLGAYSYRFMR